MARAIIAGLLLILGAACAPDAERAAPVPPAGEKVDAVNNLMAAFNAHDADAMKEFWHQDVAWIEVAGERSTMMTSSAAQLHDELVAYFENFPSVSSSLENITVNGNYVSAVERAVWEEGGQRKAQASIVVYEIIDGKVKRFWYFPAQ